MKIKTDIFEEVRKVITDSIDTREESITEDTKIADLTEDSIQLFELILSFEKKYGVKTTYEDIVKLQTVGDVVTYIAREVYRVE